MDSKRINFYTAGCDATVSFRKEQDENGKTTGIVFKAELSAPQESVWGRVLSRIYYDTTILADVFSSKERSGYPHNGGSHSLTLIVRRDFLKKINEFVSAIFEKFLDNTPIPESYAKEVGERRKELRSFLNTLRIATQAVEVSAQEYRHHDSLYATNGFVCPKCGGNMFGTMSYPYFEKKDHSENNAVLQKNYIRLGHCNRTYPDVCGFKWDRNNEDQEDSVIHFFERGVYALSYHDFIRKSTPEFAVDAETGRVFYSIPDELQDHPFLPYMKRRVFENIQDARTEFQRMLSSLEADKSESEFCKSDKRVREVNALCVSFVISGLNELLSLEKDYSTDIEAYQQTQVDLKDTVDGLVDDFLRQQKFSMKHLQKLTK